MKSNQFDRQIKVLDRDHPALLLALTYHRTHKNEEINFKNYEYLKAIYTDDGDYIVVIKSTQCFHPDTRILTDHGYIKIDKVKVGDNVLTKDTGFQRINKIFIRRADKLMSIRADNMDDVFPTLDHPFFYYPFKRKKYHYTYEDNTFKDIKMNKIANINPGSFLVHPGSFTIRNQYNLNIMKYADKITDQRYRKFKVKYGQRYLPESIKMNFESGMLFGFFLSEGHVRKLGTNIGYSFNVKEIKYRDQVLNALQNIFGIFANVAKITRDNCIRINFHDRALHDFYRNMGKDTYTRKPLNEFYQSNDDFLKGLIYGIFCGDGRIKNNQVSLHVKSEELRYFAKWILSKFGYVSRNHKDSLTINSQGSIFIKRICGLIPDKNTYGRNVELEKHVAVRLKKTSWKSYSGKVYNLNIENDNTFVANGYMVHNCGISEWLLINAITKSISKRSVFYVLPTDRLVGRFVKNRVDRSIEYTSYYKKLKAFKNAGIFAESVSLKHIGEGSIAFVGSNSTSAFTEYPADDLIIDELDECTQENLPMAVERLSASMDKRIIKVGNPSIPGFGIDDEYQKSDRKEWNIKCPSCGKWIVLDWFRNVVQQIEDGRYLVLDDDWKEDCGMEARCICDKCKKPIDRLSIGKWVRNADSDISGYHISKLFSPTMTMLELLQRFSDGLTNDSKMQRFYNGDLGLPYTAQGAKLNYQLLQECIEDYAVADGSDQPCIMGIDVGTVLHVTIGTLLADNRIKVLWFGIVNDEDDIKELWIRFRVRCGVIDALPEQRMARKLCAMFRTMFTCFYGTTKVDRVNVRDRVLYIDRTAAMDAVKESVLMKNILFPQGSDKKLPLGPDGFSEFFYQLTTSTRIFNEEKEQYEWKEGGKPDHFCHSLVYLLQARKILARLTK